MRSYRLQGNAEFLNGLDPAFVAKDLVDDRFVKSAIEQLGGPEVFGASQNYSRTELIVS